MSGCLDGLGRTVVGECSRRRTGRTYRNRYGLVNQKTPEGLKRGRGSRRPKRPAEGSSRPVYNVRRATGSRRPTEDRVDLGEPRDRVRGEIDAGLWVGVCGVPFAPLRARDRVCGVPFAPLRARDRVCGVPFAPLRAKSAEIGSNGPESRSAVVFTSLNPQTPPRSLVRSLRSLTSSPPFPP